MIFTRKGVFGVVGSVAAIAALAYLCWFVFTPVHHGRYESPTLEEMAGQMIMVGFRGMDANGPIAEDVAEGRIGGVVLFDFDVVQNKFVRNIKNPDQVESLARELQELADERPALFIAVDQEGGRVARLSEKYGFPPTESAQSLGDRGDLEYTRQAGAAIGGTMSGLGLNVDFAPVVDVNLNPENPVIGKIERSFSADPEIVADQAMAFIDGLHEHHILSSIKHFPGHGSAWNDSHEGMADVTETWSEVELIPYERIIRAGKCDMVMTAHIFNADLDPEHPATLSTRVITDILRGRLGFQGVVVSDDLQMRAVADMYGLEETVYLAVNAGVDILLFGNNLSNDSEIPEKVQALVVRMVNDGRISRERIEQSYERIMLLKEQLGGEDKKS